MVYRWPLHRGGWSSDCSDERPHCQQVLRAGRRRLGSTVRLTDVLTHYALLAHWLAGSSQCRIMHWSSAYRGIIINSVSIIPSAGKECSAFIVCYLTTFASFTVQLLASSCCGVLLIKALSVSNKHYFFSQCGMFVFCWFYNIVHLLVSSGCSICYIVFFYRCIKLFTNQLAFYSAKWVNIDTLEDLHCEKEFVLVVWHF